MLKLGYFAMPLHPVGRDWRRTLAEDREAILPPSAWDSRRRSSASTSPISPRPHLVPVVIATLARDTHRIRLGSGTVNLANRHPAATAAEIAMVDTLLEGRFILGVGPGGLRSDAEMMETLDEDRNAIFVEAMEHMIALWTQEPPYRLKGRRWHLTTEQTWTPDLGMGGMLKPFQKPHPPIVVTAILPDSNGIAAAAARGWTPISANFVHPWSSGRTGRSTRRAVHARGCRRGTRTGASRRASSSPTTRDSRAHDARARQSFAYYFRNLQRKAQTTRGNAFFKHAPSVPDEALTDEYLISQLLSPAPSTRWSIACSLPRAHRAVGTLLYVGHDWTDPAAMRRSRS